MLALALQLFGPIKQWGFPVKDLDQAMAYWKDILGARPWCGYRNVTLEAHIEGQVNEVNMDVGLAYQNGVQIEFIPQTNDVLSP